MLPGPMWLSLWPAAPVATLHIAGRRRYSITPMLGWLNPGDQLELPQLLLRFENYDLHTGIVENPESPGSAESGPRTMPLSPLGRLPCGKMGQVCHHWLPCSPGELSLGRLERPRKISAPFPNWTASNVCGPPGGCPAYPLRYHPGVVPPIH